MPWVDWRAGTTLGIELARLSQQASGPPISPMGELDLTLRNINV
jgi:hypothetical protein